jgi:ribonuclease HI
MKIKIYTDGGARGNPGIAGIGVVIKNEDNKVIFQEKKNIGIRTNNEAEYMAVIEGLKWVEKNRRGIEAVVFYADSELLVRQLKGEYRVKAKNLAGYYYTVQRKVADLELGVVFKQIGREENGLADYLANLAMDEGEVR